MQTLRKRKSGVQRESGQSTGTDQKDFQKKRIALGERNVAKKAKSGGKICPEGKAWAKRTFDTYPSAYANLAASKYCKDPNYAKGSKKRKKKAKGGFVSIRGQGAVMSDRLR